MNTKQSPTPNREKPKELKNISVYETAEQIVITGEPQDDEHNCDLMGCGQEHVIYRFYKP